MTDLRSYLGALKKTRDLKTVKRSVSTKYEIAALTAKADGSFALLFEKIKGKKRGLQSKTSLSRGGGGRYGSKISLDKKNIAREKNDRKYNFKKKTAEDEKELKRKLKKY